MQQHVARSKASNQEYRDFVHTGPGTLAGRYLRTFWQPVYRTEDLKPKSAKPIRIMGEDFTLYRGEAGEPHLVEARCRHRGALLSVGWVEGDSIRCFYHGWKYNASGQCVEQPAEPKPFCQDVRVVSYPVRDYLGLIFAYMGEGQPPPFPSYPNFEDDTGFQYAQINYRGFNYFQDFENGMDRVHGGFVHKTLPGSYDGETDSPVVRAEEDEWGLTTFAEHPSGRKGVQSFGMPNKQHLVITFSDVEALIWKVPVDDENTVHFVVSMLRGEDAIQKYHDEQALRRQRPQLDACELAREVVAGRLHHDDVDPLSTEMIWFQDDIILLAQGVIADRENEYLGASDAPIMLLRKLWEREMRALATGAPLKQWTYNPSAQLRRQ